MVNTSFEMILESIDTDKEAPAREPLRQFYFIKKLRKYVADKEAQLGRKLTSCTTTFGCQMNARDSEKLRGILEQIGFEITEDEKADFVVYNTCTVRENANTKVYGRLGRLHAYKNQNPDMQIALCGCMMQEAEVVRTLQEKYRFVDIVFGTHNIFKLAELIYRSLHEDSMVVDVWEGTDQIIEDLPVERKHSFKSGLNIMFGCDNFCSYCIVPYVRGRERSRNPEEILKEAASLAEDGVKELMLLGQNVNSYGKTLEHPMTFAALLEQVAAIEKIERIRFMTSHPKDLSDELIQVMKKEPKICRHIHLPLQSGSSRILKKMNRSYSKESYLALVRKIREALPDVSLTTDIIVGFPGETEEDFQETLDVVRQVEYDSAFTFIYSKRSGTPAAKLEEQIGEGVVKERFNRLLAEVQEIGRKRCARLVGQTKKVLIEQINEQDSTLLTGRLEENILVHLKGSPALIGEIVPVTLDTCHGFYYMGHLADQA